MLYSTDLEAHDCHKEKTWEQAMWKLHTTYTLPQFIPASTDDSMDDVHGPEPSRTL